MGKKKKNKNKFYGKPRYIQKSLSPFSMVEYRFNKYVSDAEKQIFRSLISDGWTSIDGGRGCFKKFEYIQLRMSWEERDISGGKTSGWQLYVENQKFGMMSPLKRCIELSKECLEKNNNAEFVQNLQILQEKAKREYEDWNRQKCIQRAARMRWQLEKDTQNKKTLQQNYDKANTQIAEFQQKENQLRAEFQEEIDSKIKNLYQIDKNKWNAEATPQELNYDQILTLYHENKDYLINFQSDYLQRALWELDAFLKDIKQNYVESKIEAIKKEAQQKALAVRIEAEKRIKEAAEKKFETKKPYILNYGLTHENKPICYIGCSEDIQSRLKMHVDGARKLRRNATPHEIIMNLAIRSNSDYKIEHLTNFKTEKEAIQYYYKNKDVIISNLVEGGFHDDCRNLPYLGGQKGRVRWKKLKRKLPSFSQVIDFLQTH